MNTSCPPTVFTRVSVTVERVGPGLFDAYLTHYHQGEFAPHCAVESYTHLSWTEVNDVVLAELDCHRPGAMPALWEQLEFEFQDLGDSTIA